MGVAVVPGVVAGSPAGIENVAAELHSALSDGLLERSFECECLERALEQAAAGSGSLVLVEGEAGVGKSSLIHALGGEAAWRGFTWLAARGRELEREVPYGVAGELVAPLVRGARRSGAAVGMAIDRARQLLVPSGGTPRADIDPRPAVIDALVSVLDRFLGGQDGRPPAPLLVSVDDAHWADCASLRFLGHLAERTEQRPLAIVVALRPDPPEAASPDLRWLRTRPGLRALRPAPLTEAAVEQLVRARFPGCQPQFWRACAQASGGNPFLLGELLSALADDGVRGTDDDSRLARTLVPDTVLRSTLGRLGRLSPAAAALATAVAVLNEAPLEHAAALAGLDPKAAEEAADGLARARILCAEEPLRFVHPLVASAVYADLAPFRRARLHRQAARLLFEHEAGAERVGGHLLSTHPHADAWVVERLRQAGAAALAGGEPSSAVRFLARALAEPPARSERVDVLAELAQAEARSGDRRALQHLDQALTLLDDPARRAQSALELTGLLLARLELRDAAEIARRGLADAAAAARPDLADALLAIDLTVGCLSPDRAAALDRVATLRREALAGRGPRTPELLTLIAVTASCAGDPPAVVMEMARRAQNTVPADPTIAEIFMLWFLPLALIQVDEFDEAQRLIQSSLVSAEREGRVLACALARQWQAHVFWHVGQLEAAVAEAESALAVREHGWEGLSSQTCAILAHARLDLGDHEGALAAIRLGEATSGEAVQALLLHARGRVALEAGDAAAALADFESTGRYLQALGMVNPALIPWRSASALALRALGQRDRATALAEEEIAEARRIGVNRPLGVALCAAGILSPAERAVDVLGEAVAVLERSPAQLEHTRALVEFGTALRRRGYQADARTSLLRALEWAEERGAAALAQRTRQELRACGARPRRAALTGPAALTATERRIAEMATAERSNRQIAAELSVTTKTVEWHLANVYRKLGIASRKDLRQRPTTSGRAHDS